MGTVLTLPYTISTTTKTIMLFEIISDNVDFMFTDVEEIGSSDVSICVNRIIKEYAPFTEDYASTPTRQVIRRIVNNCINSLYSISDQSQPICDSLSTVTPFNFLLFVCYVKTYFTHSVNLWKMVPPVITLF